MARYMRTDLGRGHSSLKPPVVVGAGIAWHGPGVYLTYPNRVQDQAGRRRTEYKLRPPTVVTEAVTQTFTGPSTHLTRVRRAGPVHSSLRPPVIPPLARPSQTHLAPQRRGVAKSRLPQVVPPVVVVAQISYGPSITLARIRPPRVYPDLGQPIVVFPFLGALGWIGIQLAPQRRGQAKSFLRAPVVAPALVQVYYGPEVTLTRRRTPAVRSVLRPPVIPPLARPTEVTLAPQRRGVPHSFLQPPRVVFLAVEIYGPEVHVTRIRPRPTTYLLQPPTVVTPVVVEVYYGPKTHLTLGRGGAPQSLLRPPVVVFEAVEIHGPEVHLTRIKPVRTQARLFAPTVVLAAAVFFGPEVTLTRIRPVRTQARLFPPAVVAPVLFFGPTVTLAPSFRGIPKSRLFAPAVVDQPPAFLPAEIVWLSYSSRGKARSRLFPPAVTGAGKVNPALRRYLVARKVRLLVPRTRYFLRPPVSFEVREAFYGPQITLAPSFRGRAKSSLEPPTVVAVSVAILDGPSVSLTYFRRRRVRYFLAAPRVVRLAVEIYGPETWLTYSRRGRPQYQLNPPAVVGKAPFRALQVHLTYSRRGRPISFRQPERVGIAPHRPIQVYLTRITPRPTVALIKPPTVVGAGIAFFGPSVTLVRITPPPVISFLKLTLVAFRRPGGDVCGFDVAGSFVCYLELPGSQVSGTERAGSQISGSSRAGTTMSGSDNAGSSVSGSDRKAT